jgi:hypothetical protein
MRQDPAKRLRTRLISYLNGRTRLKAFRHWFIPTYWNVSQWASPDLQHLVNKVDLYLIEYENGHRTERQLKDALRFLVARGSQPEASLTPKTPPVAGSKQAVDTGSASRATGTYRAIKTLPFPEFYLVIGPTPSETRSEKAFA